jgi:vancomycin resistance protein VanJ
VGILLRFTIQDRSHPLALAYYVTPIPAFPIWWMIASWMSRQPVLSNPSRVTIWKKRLNWLAMLVLVGWAFRSEYLNRSETPSPNDIKLVFWNTARIPFGVAPVARELLSKNPSLIGLVEAHRATPGVIEEWKRNLPGYTIATAHDGGLLAVKGRINAQIEHVLPPKSWCEQLDITVEGRDLTVLIVDIAAELKLSRRQPIEELAALTQRLADRPLVIVGDFNTPDDSVLFEPLRNHCRCAFRERGSGYAATWPMPLPVLTLDQVWVNQHIAVSSCRYDWSVRSDHRPAVCQFSVKNH